MYRELLEDFIKIANTVSDSELELIADATLCGLDKLADEEADKLEKFANEVEAQMEKVAATNYVQKGAEIVGKGADAVKDIAQDSGVTDAAESIGGAYRAITGTETIGDKINNGVRDAKEVFNNLPQEAKTAIILGGAGTVGATGLGLAGKAVYKALKKKASPEEIAQFEKALNFIEESKLADDTKELMRNQIMEKFAWGNSGGYSSMTPGLPGKSFVDIIKDNLPEMTAKGPDIDTDDNVAMKAGLVGAGVLGVAGALAAGKGVSKLKKAIPQWKHNKLVKTQKGLEAQSKALRQQSWEARKAVEESAKNLPAATGATTVIEKPAVGLDGKPITPKDLVKVDQVKKTEKWISKNKVPLLAGAGATAFLASDSKNDKIREAELRGAYGRR